MEWDILAIIIGLVSTPYLVMMGRTHMRLTKLQERIEETYTKKETTEMVGLMTNPIKDTTDRLIQSQEKLTDAIHKLELTLASNDQ